MPLLRVLIGIMIHDNSVMLNSCHAKLSNIVNVDVSYNTVILMRNHLLCSDGKQTSRLLVTHTHTQLGLIFGFGLLAALGYYTLARS